MDSFLPCTASLLFGLLCVLYVELLCEEQKILLLSVCLMCFPCSRQGVFDWLIGREEEGWPQVKVFYHNFAGMALRGLAWTAPQGYILYHMGYGWQFSMTGCLMSTPYAFGWSLQSYWWMAAGQPWSETIWGYWIWVVSITTALAGLLERLRENHSRSGHGHLTPNYLSSFITNRSLAILFEVWNVLLTIIFLCSTVFYSLTQQRDTRNKAQTFFGMFTVTLAQFAAQAVVFTAVWLTKYKDIDLTYEMRGVAILCQSPLILRNKVHFSANRFASPLDASDEAQPFESYQQGLGAGRGQVGSINQQPELGSESDSTTNTDGDQLQRRRSRQALSHSLSSEPTDSDSDDIDWSIALSEPSSSVQAWLHHRLPNMTWYFFDTITYSLFPACFRLVQGIIALIGCGVVTYITISAVLWNLQGPRIFDVCHCTQ